MNKFTEEILKNKTFLGVFYNFLHYYKNSDYEENMKDFYNSLNSKINFISKNTDWLFITDDGECYGLLGKFVMKVDSEGEFTYVCHGFENLVKMLLSDKLNLLNANYYCKKKSITLDRVLHDYEMVLNKYNLNIDLIINAQEFEDYLKSNGVYNEN